ncbi:MAG: hypothetical protein SFV17_10325 [Candidatus Obscuribacter sp.]|nr:hypothetical protein [Candidatus Obscuribacter sp.]
MTPPIFVLFELAVASLLAAATARFNLQVVGANLPTCNKEELQATVKQTTGFALVASAFTLHTDNFLAGTAHGVYVGLVVSGIMMLVLLWEALPEILAQVCRTIDTSAESLAASVESALSAFAPGMKLHSRFDSPIVLLPKNRPMFTVNKRVPGTEGTENYVCLAQGKLGVVAVQVLGLGKFRLRVEPVKPDGIASMAAVLRPEYGWKQPGEGCENRFSRVVSHEGFDTLLRDAMKAIRADLDEDALGTMAGVVACLGTSRDKLLKLVRSSKLPGCNLAGNWTTTTLVRKYLEANPNATWFDLASLSDD